VGKGLPRELGGPLKAVRVPEEPWASWSPELLKPVLCPCPFLACPCFRLLCPSFRGSDSRNVPPTSCRSNGGHNSNICLHLSCSSCDIRDKAKKAYGLQSGVCRDKPELEQQHVR
jgi:hypothetical protein